MSKNVADIAMIEAKGAAISLAFHGAEDDAGKKAVFSQYYQETNELGSAEQRIFSTVVQDTLSLNAESFNAGFRKWNEERVAEERRVAEAKRAVEAEERRVAEAKRAAESTAAAEQAATEARRITEEKIAAQARLLAVERGPFKNKLECLEQYKQDMKTSGVKVPPNNAMKIIVEADARLQNELGNVQGGYVVDYTQRYIKVCVRDMLSVSDKSPKDKEALMNYVGRVVRGKLKEEGIEHERSAVAWIKDIFTSKTKKAGMEAKLKESGIDVSKMVATMKARSSGRGAVCATPPQSKSEQRKHI